MKPPHRLCETLADFAAVFGERRIALCRELTKRNEEILRLTVGRRLRTTPTTTRAGSTCWSWQEPIPPMHLFSGRI